MSLALVIAGILFLVYGGSRATTGAMSGDPWKAQSTMRSGGLIALAGLALVVAGAVA